MLAPLDYGPEWPEIRGSILDRDGHQCRLCGQKAAPNHPLEVHHLTPLRVFLAQYTRPVARRLAHAPENLLSLCPVCHRQVERARGARTALSGLAYLLQQLAPVFLMCDPGDLGKSVEARDSESGQPVIIVYDEVPGGVGLTPRLVDLWPKLAEAALERVTRIAGSARSRSFMGSDFRYDDFELDDGASGEHLLLEETAEHWVVETKPADSDWTRVVTRISRQDELPRHAEYYDKRGELARELVAIIPTSE